MASISEEAVENALRLYENTKAKEEKLAEEVKKIGEAMECLTLIKTKYDGVIEGIQFTNNELYNSAGYIENNVSIPDFDDAVAAINESRNIGEKIVNDAINEITEIEEIIANLESLSETKNEKYELAKSETNAAERKYNDLYYLCYGGGY